MVGFDVFVGCDDSRGSGGTGAELKPEAKKQDS